MRYLIPLIVLILGLVATWTVGYLVHAAIGTQVAISVLIVALGLAWMAVAWLLKRLAKKPAPPAPKPAAAGGASIADLEAQWQQAVAGIRAARLDRQVFTEQPWYLVIGAPGSGKTSVLSDSGLTFSTTGAGAAPQTGAIAKDAPKGTKSFEWFRTDDAVFIDTAGGYVTDAARRAEWTALLHLIAATRRGIALNGVIVCVNTGDLIKKGEAALAAEAQANRDRIDEIVAQTGAIVPVYTMFTKFDSIGGFKDFFADISRTDKDQVWGCTVPWEQTDLQQAWNDEYRGLFNNLQSKRLAVLASDHTEDQLKKLYQFPIQFLAVQKWISEFVAALIKADHLKENAVFRGFYFSSCFHPTKVPGRVAYEGGANPMKGAAIPSARPSENIEASVFLSTSQVVVNQGAPNPNEAADVKKGFFLRNLFTKVMIPDRGLARPTRRALGRRRTLRRAALIGAPLVAALIALWVVVDAVQSMLLVRDERFPLQQLQESERSDKKPADVLLALDALGTRIAQLAEHPRHGLDPLLDNLAGHYFNRLARLLMDACAQRLHDDLEAARAATAKAQSSDSYDQLYDLDRSYQMLVGLIPPDAAVLERVLLQNRRWYLGLETKGGVLDSQSEGLARRELALISSHAVFRPLWHLEYDKRLVERINTELGDALWIHQGYEEIIRAVQGQFPMVRTETVMTGPDKDILAVDDEFSQVFTQAGWDEAVEHAIKEKSEALARKFSEFNLHKPAAEFERRLRDQFANDFNRHWLKLLATTRLNGARELRDVPDRLMRLAGGQSPYRDFIKLVDKSHALRTSGLDFFNFSNDTNKWIDPALEAMLALNEDIKAFLAASEPGKRSGDLAKLKDLAQSFNKASAKLADVVKIIESAEKRAAVQSGLDSILRSAFATLCNEVAAEQNRVWHERVAQPLGELCAKKYPFDLTATADVPLAAFSKTFNPTSGSIWNTIRPLENLRTVQALGMPLLPVSPEYERLLKRINDLKALCFDGNSETLALPFTITLVGRAEVKDLNFAFGDQSISLYDVPDARFQIRIKEGKPPVAKVAISVVTGQWMTRDIKGEWAFLRLLREGSPVVRPEGNYTCNWLFDSKSGTKTQYTATAIVEATGIEKALVGDVFSGFACPDTVTNPQPAN